MLLASAASAGFVRTGTPRGTGSEGVHRRTPTKRMPGTTKRRRFSESVSKCEAVYRTNENRPNARSAQPSVPLRGRLERRDVHVRWAQAHGRWAAHAAAHPGGGDGERGKRVQVLVKSAGTVTAGLDFWLGKFGCTSVLKGVLSISWCVQECFIHFVAYVRGFWSWKLALRACSGGAGAAASQGHARGACEELPDLP